MTSLDTFKHRAGRQQLYDVFRRAAFRKGIEDARSAEEGDVGIECEIGDGFVAQMEIVVI